MRGYGGRSLALGRPDAPRVTSQNQRVRALAADAKPPQDERGTADDQRRYGSRDFLHTLLAPASLLPFQEDGRGG